MLVHCSKESERREKLRRVAGGRLDFRKLLDTPEGTGVSSRWIVLFGSPTSILSGQGPTLRVGLVQSCLVQMAARDLGESVKLLCLGFYSCKGFPKVCKYRSTA